MALDHPELREIGVSRERPEHLVGSGTDFLALGGISLFLFPLLVLAPSGPVEPALLVIVILVSNVINHPHFMISYKLFYEDFGAKLSGSRSRGALRWRYLFAGVVVPIVTIGGFAVLMATGSADTLGNAYNVMAFFVGWHYVKQGYGMVMLTAAKARMFFTVVEKRLLLANSLGAWMLAWMIVNRTFEIDDYLGVPVRLIDIPDSVFASAVVLFVGTTVAMLAMLARRVIYRKPTSWTGVTAYLISLYLWTVFVTFDPLVLLVTPALHSFQYLYVVARYEQNRGEATADATRWRRGYGWSIVAGIFAFWLVPLSFDTAVGYDEAYGGLAFMFMFWMGINIHHYFLDNVMWRRGNPDVSRYLFQS